eukprot:m.15684 g.15684  ORF g.15684 m.15684 type:complete len:745 (+) comp8577_c0_seq1:53-2287(+)
MFSLRSGLLQKLREPVRMLRRRMHGFTLQDLDFPAKLAAAQETSGVLWFDNLFPLKVHPLDPRLMLFSKHSKYLKYRLKRLVPKMAETDITITKVVPVPKEGGAFVHFQSNVHSAASVAEILVTYLKEKQPRSMFIRQPVKSHLVIGRPFVNDMITFPSKNVRIDFTGPIPDTETLFRALRPYGRMLHLDFHTAGDVKYALAQFDHFHGAIASRNCLHGFRMTDPATVLHITFEPYLSSSKIKEFFRNNTRLLVPLLLSAGVALVYAAFEPIRAFFITNRVTNRFQWRWNVMPDFVKGKIENIPFSRKKKNEKSLEIWSQESFQTLQRMVKDKVGTAVIFLAGPKGCGKSTMGARLRQETPEGVTIDLRAHDTFSTDDDLRWTLVKSVNFTPSLSWLFKLQHYVEQFVAMSTRGVLSPSSTTQRNIEEVFNTTAHVLEKLKAKRADTDPVPLILINGFTGVFIAEHTFFAKKLLEWSSQVTRHGLAHVVVLSDNSAASDSEDSGMEVHTIRLEDQSKEHTMQYLKTNTTLTDAELDSVAGMLGGRLVDVNDFCVRINGGHTPHEAMEDIRGAAITTIRRAGFGIGTSQSPVWSRVQMWFIVNLLHRYKQVDYDKVLFSSLFSDGEDEKALRAMQVAHLISVVRTPEGRLAIRAARPLFHSAFAALLADDTFSITMNNQLVAFQVKRCEDKIRKLDEDLLLLQGMGKEGAQADTAVRKAGLVAEINKQAEAINHLRDNPASVFEL